MKKMSGLGRRSSGAKSRSGTVAANNFYDFLYWNYSIKGDIYIEKPKFHFFSIMKLGQFSVEDNFQRTLIQNNNYKNLQFLCNADPPIDS
jgi:hypothetical protein